MQEVQELLLLGQKMFTPNLDKTNKTCGHTSADSRTMEMMLPAPNTQSPSLPCVALGADAGCFRCIAASGHAVHLWDIRQLGAPHDAACVDKKVINTDFVGGWGHKIMALSMGSRGRFVLQSCKLA